MIAGCLSAVVLVGCLQQDAVHEAGAGAVAASPKVPRPQPGPGLEAESNFQRRYTELLRNVDASGMVDYRAVQSSGDLEEAAGDLALIPGTDLQTQSVNDRIAFWINAYNFLTIKAVTDHYPIRSSFFTSLVYPKNSIRQIPGVWDRLQFRVAGELRTLDEIEHSILRREFAEPRVHMALVCAAKGCPVLRNEPYIGADLDAQLDDQTRRFVRDPRKVNIDRSNRKVGLSPIFKWYGADFLGTFAPGSGFGSGSPEDRAVLAFIAGHVSHEDAAFLEAGDFDIEFLDYDWSLNEQGLNR